MAKYILYIYSMLILRVNRSPGHTNKNRHHIRVSVCVEPAYSTNYSYEKHSSYMCVRRIENLFLSLSLDQLFYCNRRHEWKGILLSINSRAIHLSSDSTGCCCSGCYWMPMLMMMWWHFTVNLSPHQAREIFRIREGHTGDIVQCVIPTFSAKLSIEKLSAENATGLSSRQHIWTILSTPIFTHRIWRWYNTPRAWMTSL